MEWSEVRMRKVRWAKHEIETRAIRWVELAMLRWVGLALLAGWIGIRHALPHQKGR